MLTKIAFTAAVSLSYWGFVYAYYCIYRIAKADPAERTNAIFACAMLGIALVLYTIFIIQNA